MEAKTSAYISRKAFLQSAIILLLLMLLAGVLTQLVPAGKYTRSIIEGREVIDPDSFILIEPPDYPIWRWFTAPFEVLGGPDGLTIIVIAICGDFFRDPREHWHRARFDRIHCSTLPASQVPATECDLAVLHAARGDVRHL